MSIKYLQDQQLNQVQQSPNNSPWAKLIAQSEMLERNKMRQPQGQAPQGTVAGNIQQQLIDAQMKQESEAQNADLYKSQMLAQLIGSGQIPANFSAQGYADGGLAQPQAGTGAYRGIVMPSQGAGANPSYAPKQPTLSYVPPSSQDPAAQEKKHGMLQTLLDNSMYSGKGTIDSNMQMYSDMATGKLFGRGFAEGGDVRGFAGGGGLENFLNRYPSYTSILYRQAAEEKAAKLRAIQEQAAGAQRVLPAPGPTSASSLEAVLGKDANVQDFINSLNAKQAAASNVPTQPQEVPTAPQVKTLPHIAQVSESPELQEYYKSLYEPKPDATRGDILSQLGKANAPGEDQMRIPTREDMMRQAQGPSTGTDSLAEFKNRMYGADPSVVNPARSNLMGTLLNVAEQKEAANPARSNLMGTLLNVAEQKEALANQPKPSMTEGMSAAAQNPPRIDTMASRMAAADKANDIKLGDPMAPGATTFEEMAAKAKQGLGSLGEAASAVGRPIAKVAGALSPIGDLMMANKFTGGSNALLAQALSGQTPSGAMQGDIPEVAKDLMTTPSIPDWAKNIGSAINSKVPSVPQTDISQFGVDTKAAIPQQPTIGDFSGSATPQAQTPQQGVRKREDGVIVNSKSAGKAPDTKQNGQVTSDTHGYGTPNSVDSHPAGNPINALLTTTQATQAADKTSDTGMGQGSILDSLYSKLKDTDVDYSDLAKRISENEYDLARERKDGTFNAILGGVGAALSKAGTYESHGDRVFRPGYGAIAGAGITGGLKMANESDAAIAKKSQDNTMSMLALKKLKGDSLNNVLDAISAQKQNEVYARSVAQSGEHNIATAKHQAGQLVEEAKKTDILQQAANTNAARVNAEIEDLKNKMPPADAAMLTSLSKTIDDAQAKINGMDKGFVAKDDAEYLRAQTAYNNAFNALNGLYSKYGINLGAGANAPVRGPNAIKVISRERI